MAKTRIGEIEKLRKYPPYLIKKEINKFVNPDWYKVCSENGVFNIDSKFWEEFLDDENFGEIFNAFFGVAEKFFDLALVDETIRESLLYIFSMEQTDLYNNIIFRRLKFLIDLISKNVDFDLHALFFRYINRYVNETGNLTLLYYFILHSKTIHPKLGNKTLHYVLDMILNHRELNWSSIISNIYYSKIYTCSDIELIQRCVDSFEKSFLLEGYSTWLLIDGEFKEIKINVSNDGLFLEYTRTKDEPAVVLSNDNLTELSTIDLVTKISAALVKYQKDNKINNEIEYDYYENLIYSRNTFGFMNREFQFGFHNNNMKQFQCLGCLINFGLNNLTNKDIDIKGLYVSKFDFITFYSLYLMSHYNLKSEYKLLVENPDVSKKLITNPKVAFYFTEILKDYLDILNRVDNSSELVKLNSILKGLEKDETVNKILVSLEDRINFKFDKYGDEVITEIQNPVSFGTIKEVSVIDCETLSNLKHSELIALLNDIESNEENYTVEEENFITKNGRGTFEYISKNLDSLKGIFTDGLTILKPRVIYYIFDKLLEMYDKEWVLNYSFSSLNKYGFERNLVSKISWYINDNYNDIRTDNDFCISSLELYRSLLLQEITYDGLEIDPGRTKYKTISYGVEYIDLDNRFINSVEHNLFNPIYLLEVVVGDFSNSFKVVKRLQNEQNPWVYFILYKYQMIFKNSYKYDWLETGKDVKHKEISVFGVFSSRAMIPEYYKVIRLYISENPTINLISKNIDAFIEGYSLYAIAGVINNWGSELFDSLFEILDKHDKGYHDLSQIMMGLRNSNIDNQFILRSAIDYLLNVVLRESRQAAISNAITILPMFRSIHTFSKETIELFDNIVQLLDESKSYERLSFINFVTFGIKDTKRTDEEKEIISNMLGKLKVDDFDSYENEQLKELKELLIINQE